jgi:pantetheine-phosphate adenylyltransferase
MMQESLGLYAGSFNPFHVGHWDVVKQATQVFDHVLVAKGVNPEKAGNDVYQLPETFLMNGGVKACTFDGLLVDLIRRWEKIYNVTLVRGLRSGADLDYEQNFAAFLRGMYPQVKLVAFYCDPKLRHISSSSLRGIQKISEDEYRKYVIAD